MQAYNIEWLCDSPSPYNDHLFINMSHETDIDLTVYFQKSKLSSHPWEQPMAQNYRSYYANNSLDLNIILSPFVNRDSLFVVGSWNNLNAILLIVFLIITRRHYIIWTDTPNTTKNRTFFKIFFRKVFLRIIFANACKVFGTGEKACEILHKMGCQKKKLINFPYWTSLPYRFSRKQTSTINFFSIGRLDQIKGFDLAIQALGNIYKYRPLSNVQYTIIGDGTERKKLEKLSKNLEIDHIVKFEGWKDPEFIQEEMNVWDVLIHPAHWEPYGVVILESMAHGKPVVASNKTMAAIDRVKHGVNGFIFNIDNIQDLEKKIEFFLDHPDMISDMGEHAHTTAHNWPVRRGIMTLRSIVKGLKLV